jgi:hypothetical protein
MKIWKMSKEILTNYKTNKKDNSKKVKMEDSKIQTAMLFPCKVMTKNQ